MQTSADLSSTPTAPVLLESLADHFYRVAADLYPCGETRSILIAATNPGEGASTVALNLAAALSRNPARRVLLVDANVRTPQLHTLYGVSRTPGLSDLLQRPDSGVEAAVPVGDSGMHLLPAGTETANPIMLFEAATMQPLMQAWRQRFDAIVIDAAPLVRYPETLSLAAGTDGVVLVLEAERTRQEVARAGQSLLERSQIPLCGTILNKKQHVIPQPIYRLL